MMQNWFFFVSTRINHSKICRKPTVLLIPRIDRNSWRNGGIASLPLWLVSVSSEGALSYDRTSTLAFKSRYKKGILGNIYHDFRNWQAHERYSRFKSISRVFYSQPALTCSKWAMEIPHQYVCEICSNGTIKTPERCQW